MTDDRPSWSERGLPPSLDPRAAGGRRGRRRLARRYGSAVVLSSFLPPPRSSRAKLARAASWVALSLSVVMLTAFVGGFALYRHFEGNLTRTSVFPGLSVGDRPTKAAQAGAALNVLLVGSDTRSGQDQEFADQNQYVGGARSDTTIVAHISADRSTAVLMSIPRDLLVDIPRCTNPQTGTTYGPLPMTIFNASFARGDLDEGNPACLIATVEKLTGIQIDHYIEVDFVGFRTMVDALDGVPICLARPLNDTENIVDLPAGRQVLDGAEALGFVRARKGITNSTDLGRINRQKAFLSAMIRKATSTGILLRPDRLYSFLNAASKSLNVDQQLTLGQLRTIATSLGDLDPSRVTFVTVPYDPDPGPQFERGGRYYGRLKLDEGRARPLFESLITDTPLPGESAGPSATPSGSPSPSPSPTGPALLVAPPEVTVDVLNGNGTTGAAGSAADALAGLGFDIGRVGDANERSFLTEVRYGPDQFDSARTLAAAVPGAVLLADDTLGSRVELIVGADFPDQLEPVTVGAGGGSADPTATPSSSPTGPAALDTRTADEDGCV